MNRRPNKAAARERRDYAAVSFERHWRGVGEPGRWLNMNSPATYVALFALLSGCATHPPHVSPDAAALPFRLDSYFEDYCDYTGSLGIGFEAWHTYDYRFRQHLKTTPDPELKRLFVLRHLFSDVESELRDFERGIVRTGKTSSRALTLSEWQSTQQRIQARIADLSAYSACTNISTVSADPMDRSDPALEASWVEELRETLRSITNAPAANQKVERTGAPPRSSDPQ
jgi:hypothetical protein